MKKTKFPHYSTWFDATEDVFEVVRWSERGKPTVVQTNILTYEKAHVALAEWRKREEATDAG